MHFGDYILQCKVDSHKELSMAPPHAETELLSPRGMFLEELQGD